MATFREKLNSRKLAVATGCIILATALLIAKLIEADHWVTVVITVGAAYMGSQAYVDGRAKQNRSLANAMARSREY